MAAKTLTYKDLPPELRQTAAAAARDQMRVMMANPFMPPEQRALIESQLEALTLWEVGGPQERPKASPVVVSTPELPGVEKPAPRLHSVEIFEKLGVVESGKTK